MRRSLCLGCFGVLGVVLLILGAVVAGLFDSFINSIVAKELVIRNGTDLYEKWRQPPVVPHLNIYFFNVTNVADFLNGAKPVLQEVGPYTYREHWEKVNISFHDNGTVTYETQKYYFFEREHSVGSEEDMITSLNLPMMTALSKWRFAARLAKLALSSMLEVLKIKPFVTHSVKEFMWGYDDALLRISKDILPPDQRPPFEKFGFFINRNGSGDGILNVFTGEDGDMTRYTTIDRFNYQDSLNYWRSDDCNTIKGSDGSSFPPGITKSTVLQLFNKNLCRSIPLTYLHNVNDFGVQGMRFSPPVDVFANVTVKPENMCYCPGGPPCAGSGLFNISSCKFGSPTLVSWPHFYQADPMYLEEVEGLKPDPEKHTFFIDVSPHTGTPLRAQARLQINVAVPHLPEVEPAKHLREMIFPILWFQSGVSGLPSDVIEQLQMAENTPPVVKASLELGLFVFGGLLVVFVCMAILAGYWDLPIPYFNPNYAHRQGKVVRKGGLAGQTQEPKPELNGHTNTMVSDHPETDQA